MKKKPDFAKIAKELINIANKLADDDKTTIEKVHETFFKLMKKHDISWGEKEGNGIVGATPQWTMCKTLFFEHFNGRMDIKFLFKSLGYKHHKK